VGLSQASGGYVGVDVFFVISGFLITTGLLRSLETDGRIRFADFYARRARRILPASLTVLVLAVAGSFLWVPPLVRTQVLRDAIATALYVPNYSFAVQGTDYLAESDPSVFQHYWSLGVEEQFYLLWPALLALAFWAGTVLWAHFGRRVSGRVSGRFSGGSNPRVDDNTSSGRSAFGGHVTVLILLICLIVASFAVGVSLTQTDQPWAFFSLWTRAWELGLGALVALALRGFGRNHAEISDSRERRTPRAQRPGPRLPVWLAVPAGWAGLAGIVYSCVAFTSDTPFPGTAVALPVAATALVIFAGATPSRFGPGAVLNRRPLQFLGAISYSLYLVHWPILVLAQAAVGYYTPLPLWSMEALGAAAVPIAWLLYRFVETPGRRAGWLTRARPRRSLVLTAVATLGAASLAALAIVGTTHTPLNAGKPAVAAAPTAPPTQTPYVPSNLQPTLRTANDDNPAIYADGCEVGYTPSEPHPCIFGSDRSAPRVVLFGDSHAAQWYPALETIAKQQDFRLETQTKSACPSVDAELSWSGTKYVSCDQWRASVISRIEQNPPSMVVLANYTNPDFYDPSDRAGQWQSGLEKVITELSKVTTVVVIADTPDLRNSPTVCLSANLDSADKCGVAASLALKSPGRAAEKKAAQATGVPFIDLGAYFCTSSWCPVITDNTLMYRDSHHISATYSTELAPVLAKQLVPMIEQSNAPPS
jgi:peptidoglycan/LPS O-acetylase OafA/YrhL